MTPQLLIPTLNETAFCTMVGISEGTVTSALTQDNGYDVIVTGIDAQGHLTPEIFTDYSAHPFEHRAPKPINRHGLPSTASGRYQILLHWWHVYQAKFAWPSFDKRYQDDYVLRQLEERGALAPLNSGDFITALGLISGAWASLPGKAYVGQGQHTMDQCEAWYRSAGGTVSY